MTGLEALIAPALAFLIAAGSPGPATLAVAGAAMASGRRVAMATAFGLAIGLTFWGVLAATGLGAVLMVSAPALFALRIAGGGYLLWLAWRSARAAWSPESAAGLSGEPRKASAAAAFRRGLALNLTNPKAVLAWSAAILIGVSADDGAGRLAAVTAICAATGLAIYVLYALAFSTGPAARAYARARRWIEGVFAGLFAAAGISLIFSRPAAP
ncbi:MAG: LysE family translocator [Pseudomonadota bacterium]